MLCKSLNLAEGFGVLWSAVACDRFVMRRLAEIKLSNVAKLI